LWRPVFIGRLTAAAVAVFVGIVDIDDVTAEAAAGSTDIVAAIVVVVVVVDIVKGEAETPCVLAAADMDGKVKVEPSCAPRFATFFGRELAEEEKDGGEALASESMATMVVVAVVD
jgi:hypothetical protein